MQIPLSNRMVAQWKEYLQGESDLVRNSEKDKFNPLLYSSTLTNLCRIHNRIHPNNNPSASNNLPVSSQPQQTLSIKRTEVRVIIQGMIRPVKLQVPTFLKLVVQEVMPITILSLMASKTKAISICRLNPPTNLNSQLKMINLPSKHF